jgi:hypothetical protein
MQAISCGIFQQPFLNVFLPYMYKLHLIFSQSGAHFLNNLVTSSQIKYYLNLK